MNSDYEHKIANVTLQDHNIITADVDVQVARYTCYETLGHVPPGDCTCIVCQFGTVSIYIYISSWPWLTGSEHLTFSCFSHRFAITVVYVVRSVFQFIIFM